MSDKTFKQEVFEEKKKRWIKNGMFTKKNLKEQCFCDSGKTLSECCAEAVAYALRENEVYKH